MLDRISRRLQSVAVAKAFDRWAEEQQQCAELRGRAVSRILNACLYAAFALWRERSLAFAKLQAKMHKALLRLRNGHLVLLRLEIEILRRVLDCQGEVKPGFCKRKGITVAACATARLAMR